MQWLWKTKKLGAISALSVLDRIVGDLRAAPQGTVFFAHLMIPHNAYILDADCRIRPDIDTWLSPFDPAAPAPFANTPASREARYEMYFDQVRCTHHKLAAIFDAMAAAGVFKDATVIVHGDHGSRIPLLMPTAQTAARLSKSDFIDNFSALFAIRTPARAAGRNQSQRSIQSLFAEMALNRPFPVETMDIFINSPTGRKVGLPLVRKTMPEFGG